MPIRIANASADADTAIWEPCLVTPVISTSTAALTAAGLFTGTFTAPNTTGKTTGCMINLQNVPTNGGNIVITLQEATVDTACVATILNADIKIGWQYVRFPTPYQWTATTAGRYRFKIQNSVGTSGNVYLIAAASTVAFIDTHDSPATLGSTDNFLVAGFHNSGITPISVRVDGTTLVNGDGADTAVNVNTPVTVGAGIQICNGGEIKWDTAANATLQTRGSVIVHDGGTYDRRGNLADRTKIVKHIIDNQTSSGQYRVITRPGAKYLTNGYELDTPYAEYLSGTGTSGSHFKVDRATDWQVGDEIYMGGDTYLQPEKRFIKAVYAPDEFQLSTTPGGAEAALTFSHTATETVVNITRNSVTDPQNAARGTFLSNGITVAADCNVAWSRWNNIAQGSGVGTLALDGSQNADFIADYLAVIGNGGGNRSGIQINSITPRTITGMVVADLAATNTGNGALSLGSIAFACISQVFVDCIFIGNTSQALLGTNLYNSNFKNCRFSANNTSGAAAGHAIALYSSGVNTFDDCRVDSTRIQGIYLNAAYSTVFNNLRSGMIGTNTTDITAVLGQYEDVLFADSNFNSATLVGGYLGMLQGSEIKFQNLNDNTSVHKWYKRTGIWESEPTTVRTPGSLSLVGKPEDATNGLNWSFKIPAAPASNVAINGYIYRNATFSSGTLKVELFLPGSLTPDETYTFPTTTGSWLPFSLTKYYSGSVARYATVRISGFTATPGAYFFVDDLYDAGINNKVAGLDLWDEGKPSEVMVVTDFSSAVPVLADAARTAVWSDDDQYLPTQKGGVVVDTNGLVSK
jgi:hypothetical protein